MLSQFILRNKAEDTIFMLSLFIALIPFSAIMSFISFYINLVFAVLIIVSVFLHIKKLFLSGWIINLLSVTLIVIPFLGYSLEDILQPSIEALTIILSIRFLGRKTSREYFQIYLISLLLLGSSSLFNISWVFLVRVLIMLVLTIFSILILTYIKETKEEFINHKKLLSLLRFSLSISVISIPLSALFFLILPRTAPLIDIGLGRAKTGFSSTINLGSVSIIEEDRSVVMRVKMDKLPEKELYWRVITFDTFDGKNWQRTILKGLKSKIYGTKINYTVNLDPTTEQYLPVIDYPLNVYLKNIFYEYPGVYKANFSIDKPIKYNATSLIVSYIEEPWLQSKYLRIPSNVSEKIRNLTHKITSDVSNEEEVLKRILKFLSNYHYSLKNLPSGNNPVEDFLFNKKSGNCEYFATTMALMLRIKGIPSRVVGGFKGGSYNPFGGYYIVRASDAHLWVEAWINGKWLRFDPSGKIYPPRENVIFYFIDYLWNSIILNYDLKAQIQLANSLKPSKLTFDRKIFLIPLFLAIVFTFLKIYQYFRKKRELLNRFFDIMKRYGFERKNHQGLEEFIATINTSALKKKAEKFVIAYEEIYFKDQALTKEKLKELNVLLKDLNETHKI